MEANATKLVDVPGWIRRLFGRNELSIRLRLIACFVLIVALMIAADAIAVWQYWQISAPAQRLSDTDRVSHAIVRVHLDVDTFRGSMAALASSHDTRQFSAEAASIRQTFLQNVDQAEQMLSATPEIEHDAPISSALETLRGTLLSQLDTAVQLSDAGEWNAIQLRLANQIPALIEFSSSLVEGVDQQALQQRRKAIEDGEKARQRLFIIVPIAALVTLLAAATLGWYLTRTVTGPLRLLTAGAEAMARGDFHHKVHLGGNNELAVLGNAFDYASLQLQKLYEDLWRGERELRGVINTVPALVWRASPDGTIDFINERLLEFVGLSSDGIAGWNWESVLHPDDRTKFVSKWHKAVRDGQSMESEVRVRRTNGEHCWFFVRTVPLRDDAGKVIKWYGSGIDIEDRKRAEESLRSSEAYLAEAQSLTQTGSCAIDGTSHETVYWSNEMFRLFGFDPQKGPPMFDQWLQRIHPEDRENLKLANERTFLNKVSCDLEFRIVKPDGTVRYIHGIGHPVLSPTGELVQVVGTMVDVTERKRADQKFRGLLESAPDAMVVMDRQGQILLVNAQAERLFGYKREELLGQDVVILMPERFRGQHSLRRTEYFAHPRVRSMGQNLELYARRSDGTEFPVEISLSPLETEEGTLVSGALRDITERKHAEQEREKLRRLEADLAHINRVSTLGEMAASLAHEIKQPIAATITSANSCMEWLAHEPPNLDRARAAVARIDKYGNRAAAIIDRIRSLYRKSPSQRELVDANGIIQEMLALLKGEADQYSIAMRTELAAELPKIMADRVQLQQVFMNLMLNAIEAMKDSGGELTVRSQHEDSQLLFSVSDTGVGLPTEKMEEIFSAFFTTKPQGSGMGLAICRSIVESHGGRLWAIANDGHGATFHFTLPITAHVVQEATGT